MNLRRSRNPHPENVRTFQIQTVANFLPPCVRAHHDSGGDGAALDDPGYRHHHLRQLPVVLLGRG